MTSDDLQEYTHLIFGENVSVEYFLKDTLFFRFPYETHKKVPVYPVHILRYDSQYIGEGDHDGGAGFRCPLRRAGASGQHRHGHDRGR